MDSTMVDVHKIQVADMDKNGALDIVVEEQDQSPLNRVAVFYNDGKGADRSISLTQVTGISTIHIHCRYSSTRIDEPE
jgi:hypothetical protein